MLPHETEMKALAGVDFGGKKWPFRAQKSIKIAKNRRGIWIDLLMTKELRILLCFLVGKITAFVILATAEPAE
jgi:hypothetical protein